MKKIKIKKTISNKIREIGNGSEIRGITLISLVITIIILIILVAVSIDLSLGENGLIKKADKSAQEYSNAYLSESEKIDYMYEQLLTGNRNSINKEELKETLAELLTPTGSIIAQMGNSAPRGYLVCNGAEYEISEYQELANYFNEQFGSAQYFGGEGTKFKVPNFNNKFMKGSNTAGVDQEAGLPNITGRFGENTLPNSNEVTEYGDSALYKYSSGGGYGHTSSGTYNRWSIGFDASKSNSIYGKSTTVTPENISVLYCIKY